MPGRTPRDISPTRRLNADSAEPLSSAAQSTASACASGPENSSTAANAVRPSPTSASATTSDRNARAVPYAIRSNSS